MQRVVDDNIAVQIVSFDGKISPGKKQVQPISIGSQQPTIQKAKKRFPFSLALLLIIITNLLTAGSVWHFTRRPAEQVDKEKIKKQIQLPTVEQLKKTKPETKPKEAIEIPKAKEDEPKQPLIEKTEVKSDKTGKKDQKGKIALPKKKQDVLKITKGEKPKEAKNDGEK